MLTNALQHIDETVVWIDVSARVRRYVIPARRPCDCSQAIDRSEIEEGQRR